jgi:hypothetical protein
LYRILAVVLLAAFSAISQAQETRYYDVEIILFENLDPAARASENWPTSVELEAPDTTIEIGQPWPGPIPAEYTPALSFKPLQAEEFRLNEQAGKIEESESRRILLHTGWRQPGMPRDTALTVHFKQPVPGLPAGLMATTPEGEEIDTGTTTAGRWLSPEAGELEGLIKVTLARYLHVEADVVFRPRLAEHGFDDINPGITTDAEQGPVVYRLKQTRRRMRSRELHYLDNPVIGMLVLITPYEVEAVKE